MKKMLLTAVSLLVVVPNAFCATSSHQNLNYQGRGTCLPCHGTQANNMFNTVHYQMLGDASKMSNPPATQGKFAGALNAFCTNINGNWNGCGSCHVGGGAMPERQVSQAQLENIDCFMCHSETYKRRRNAATGLFEPMTSAMTVKNMDTVVQQVTKPTRVICLQCHAKAAGGDNFKRGDLAIASGTSTDRNFDVHMAKTTTGNLSCTMCHTTSNHKISGQGADLYTSDTTTRPTCSTSSCHSNKVTLKTGHATTDINKHMLRVACQTCHIPTYAKDAIDTVATESTETHRDWSQPNAEPGRCFPTSVYANNLKPAYLFWNGTQRGYNLGDQVVFDPTTGNASVTRPNGTIQDGKLFPFKYKTSKSPYATARNQLLMVNGALYKSNLEPSITDALARLGYAPDEPVSYVIADTYLALNHEVSPKTQALNCSSCHPSATATQMKLNTMGYTLKSPYTTVCKQCHSLKNPSGISYTSMHNKHVTSKGYDCSFCHSFTRATERGLKTKK